MLDRATEYSRYAAAETIRHGYLTAPGGFRIGLCGTALPLEGQNEGVRDISSLAIRIPRVQEGAALPVLPELLEDGRPLSALQLEVGCHTDVMDGCPKALAVPMLLRAMTPQVIALDEVALDADVAAVCAAANCGVALLATVHAASLPELEGRPVGRALLRCGVFRRAVLISGRGSGRQVRVERLP